MTFRVFIVVLLWLAPGPLWAQVNYDPPVRKNIIAQKDNNVRKCDAFAGTTAGAKIAACIGSLPSTGGVADATGLEGAQSITADPFSGVTKPVTLQLGCATYSVSVIMTLPSRSQLIGNGRCSVLRFIDDGTAISRQLYINGVDDVTVSRITVTSTATSRTGLYGLIRIESASGIRILDVTGLVSPATCIHAIAVTDFKFDGVTCDGAFADGIHVTRGSKRGRIVNNHTLNTGDDGIGLISYTGPSGEYDENEDIVVSNNNVENVTVGRGIAIYGGNNITGSGNTINGTDQTGLIISAVGGAFSTSTTHFPKNISFTGTTILNAGRDYATYSGQGSCVYINPARHVSLTGTIMHTCGEGAISLAGVTKDIGIKGSIISYPTGRGVEINATTSTDARLIQELFTDLGESGVTTAISSSIRVNGSIIRGASTDAMYASIPAADYLYGINFDDNTIEDCETSTDAMELNRVRRSSANDSHVANCPEGIRIAASDHISLAGGMISGTTDGVLLIGSSYVNVVGGVITNNATLGVFVDETSSNNQVVNVVFDGNGTDIQDSAGDTVMANKYGTSGNFAVERLTFESLVGQEFGTVSNGAGPAVPPNADSSILIDVNGSPYKILLFAP